MKVSHSIAIGLLLLSIGVLYAEDVENVKLNVHVKNYDDDNVDVKFYLDNMLMDKDNIWSNVEEILGIYDVTVGVHNIKLEYYDPDRNCWEILSDKVYVSKNGVSKSIGEGKYEINAKKYYVFEIPKYTGGCGDGYLRIIVEDAKKVKVYVDDKDFGEMGYSKNLKLKSGKHKITLKLLQDGIGEYATTITIEDGKRKKLEIDVDKIRFQIDNKNNDINIPIKIYVDGHLLHNKVALANKNSYFDGINVFEGKHDIKIEYYDPSKKEWLSHDDHIKVTHSIDYGFKIPKIEATTKKGILEIYSNVEGCRLYINGQDFGEFGIKGKKVELDEGTYKVKISKKDYMDYISTVIINAGESKTIDANLKKIMTSGTLKITSNPSDAEVYVNGEYRGTTPLPLTLKKGTYDIRISKDGYEEYTKTVTINAGETKTIDANLQPKTFKLTVYVNNEYGKDVDFELYLDGEFKKDGVISANSNGGIGEFEVSGGSHTIELRYYDPYTEEWKSSEKSIGISEDDECDFAINPTIGTLKITSNPSDAEVYVNGEYRGTTPLTLTLKGGTYDIKISKDGYKNYSSEIMIKSDEYKIINAKLEMIPTNNNVKDNIDNGGENNNKGNEKTTVNNDETEIHGITDSIEKNSSSKTNDKSKDMIDDIKNIYSQTEDARKTAKATYDISKDLKVTNVESKNIIEEIIEDNVNNIFKDKEYPIIGKIDYEKIKTGIDYGLDIYDIYNKVSSISDSLNKLKSGDENEKIEAVGDIYKDAVVDNLDTASTIVGASSAEAGAFTLMTMPATITAKVIVDTGVSLGKKVKGEMNISGQIDMFDNCIRIKYKDDEPPFRFKIRYDDNDIIISYTSLTSIDYSSMYNVPWPYTPPLKKVEFTLDYYYSGNNKVTFKEGDVPDIVVWGRTITTRHIDKPHIVGDPEPSVIKSVKITIPEDVNYPTNVDGVGLKVKLWNEEGLIFHHKDYYGTWFYDTKTGELKKIE